MEIKEYRDYIEVIGLEDFDVKQTLECGQVFRYKVQDFGYTVYSLDHKADIYCQETIKIFTKDKKYFVNYFDFCTNYGKIKSSLGVEPMLKSAIDLGSGIRILRADLLDCSSPNEVPRREGQRGRVPDFFP